MDNELTQYEHYVYLVLKASPSMLMHITPDGNHIYVIVGEGDSEGLLNIERVDGKSYNEMDEAEINQVLIDHVTSLFE